TRPDTVTTIDSASLLYAAATSQTRRWAAVSDYFDLRLLYSNRSEAWIEVPVPGQGDDGVAIGVLDDSTALLAWRDSSRPGAGVLSGSRWTLVGPPPATDLGAGGFRMRPRPSGGQWLSWATDKEYVSVSTYRNGGW